MYYLWATAYNTAGESGPSNVLHDSFPSAERGDINRDGILDMADMDSLIRILAGEDEALFVADVDGSGSVTQDDIQALLDKMS